MIIANWKANGGFTSNIAWHKELTQIFSNDEFLDIGIAPSHIHFTQIQKIFEDSNLEVGLQDIDFSGGARTGSKHQCLDRGRRRWCCRLRRLLQSYYEIR